MNQLAVISQDLGDFQNNFFEPVNSNKLENLFIRHSEGRFKGFACRLLATGLHAH